MLSKGKAVHRATDACRDIKTSAFGGAAPSSKQTVHASVCYTLDVSRKRHMQGFVLMESASPPKHEAGFVS